MILLTYDDTTVMPNTDQIQLQRWNGPSFLSETLMREKLESQGFRCSRLDYPPGTVFPEHSHEVDKIDAVLTGKFRVTIGERQFDLMPGDALYIPRHVTHKAEVIGDETVTSLDGVKIE